MPQETNLIVHDGVVVPESALLRRDKVNEYGSVPGLPDEELADPDELERQVYIKEFGPVLALPVSPRRRSLRPNVDDCGQVDWGTFATVDFERTMPQPDKSSSRIAALHEERRAVLIKLETVKERLPKVAMHKVLRYLRKGLIGTEHIVNEDMPWAVRLDRRARRISREISRTLERRREREQRAVEATLGRW